jgi:putative tryptophan/tyrosine transport system substrate-binding protein
MRLSPGIPAAALLLLALPSLAAPPRIAWLWPGTIEGNAIIATAFRDGLRENGLVEGKHYVLDERYAEGKYERFPALAKDLLKRDPAILLVNTIASVQAAQNATKMVPIVFVGTNDPVGSGLVPNLSRPGGNTTGLSTQMEDLIDKYIELLRELLPRASRIAVLSNPNNPSCPKMLERVRRFAAAKRMAITVFDATSPANLEASFDGIAKSRPEALLVMPDASFFDQRAAISAFASAHKIPAIASFSEFVSAGCLIAFGPSRREMYRRSAIYVKKILAGAKPGEMPVEQPAKFELAINLKSARTLGITVPQSVLLRADVIVQ